MTDQINLVNLFPLFVECSLSNASILLRGLAYARMITRRAAGIARPDTFLPGASGCAKAGIETTGHTIPHSTHFPPTLTRGRPV